MTLDPYLIPDTLKIIIMPVNTEITVNIQAKKDIEIIVSIEEVEKEIGAEIREEKQ
jgi:hypothetical protein